MNLLPTTKQKHSSLEIRNDFHVKVQGGTVDAGTHDLGDITPPQSSAMHLVSKKGRGRDQKKRFAYLASEKVQEVAWEGIGMRASWVTRRKTCGVKQRSACGARALDTRTATNWTSLSRYEKQNLSKYTHKS